MNSIRVLIAIDPRMYGEALAHALRVNRPLAAVLRLEPAVLYGQLESFDPQLVVCNEATDRIRAIATSWVELSYQASGITASVCLGGRRSTVKGVEVKDVLAIMDEAERLSDASQPDG